MTCMRNKSLLLSLVLLMLTLATQVLAYDFKSSTIPLFPSATRRSRWLTARRPIPTVWWCRPA